MKKPFPFRASFIHGDATIFLDQNDNIISDSFILKSLNDYYLLLEENKTLKNISEAATLLVRCDEKIKAISDDLSLNLEEESIKLQDLYQIRLELEEDLKKTVLSHQNK